MVRTAVTRPCGRARAWQNTWPGRGSDADGGRGFGFTGGHWHWNWAHDQFRKLVLNGIAWTAGIEIPSGRDGRLETPTMEELEAHQDFPRPADFDAQALAQQDRTLEPAVMTVPLERRDP